jgi:hypothetical protein
LASHHRNLRLKSKTHLNRKPNARHLQGGFSTEYYRKLSVVKTYRPATIGQKQPVTFDRKLPSDRQIPSQCVFHFYWTASSPT